MKKAVIDIGTNSCRLFIASLENNKIKEKILKYMEITRLGENVNKTRVLSEEAMERTIKVLKKYKEKIVELKIKEVKVTATSAMRDSKNSDEFIKRVKKEVGLNIECISGKEEGIFSFLGVISEFNERIMVIDIGGGSTEFILGDKNNIEYVESFNVGAVRLKELFFKSNDYSLQKAKIWVEEILGKLQKYKNEEFILVGVAGTITTHVTLLLEMEDYDTEKIHMYKLTKLDIEKNLEKLLKSSLEERRNLKGLHPKRAEVIIPGTYILLWIMEFLGKNEIIVSESDILEGLMLDN